MRLKHNLMQCLQQRRFHPQLVVLQDNSKTTPTELEGGDRGNGGFKYKLEGE